MEGHGALESDWLRSFAVFAQHGNFTSAAVALNISQPSLHVKIRKLAAALGTELYERDGRSLVLTPAGERLAAFAHDSRLRAEEFLSSLGGEPAGLVIAAGRGAIRWVIPDAIRQAGRHGNRVRVLTCGRDEAIAALGAGRADIAVIAFDPPPRRFRAREIAAFPQVLLVERTHPLAGRDVLRLADLAGLDLVVPPAGRPHRQSLERALLDAGVPWEPSAEADGWDLLAHIASLGVGATVVNGCVPPPDGMSAVPIRELPVVRYWAAWRPQREPHVASFLTILGSAQ